MNARRKAETRSAGGASSAISTLARLGLRSCRLGSGGAILAALAARWSAPRATLLSRPLFRRPSFSRRCSTCSNTFVQARTETPAHAGDRSWGQVARGHPRTIPRFRARKRAICWPFVKPSPGLEPGTASLPWRLRPLLGRLGKPPDRPLSLQDGQFFCYRTPSSKRLEPPR